MRFANVVLSLASLVGAQETKRIFFFGDSYTSTGYDPNGAQPNTCNPLGNPPLPGQTLSGGLNWAGFLVTELATSKTAGYDYAFSGAVVDKAIVPGYGEGVRSFTEQIELWQQTAPSVPYTSNNTLVGALFGINDILSEFWPGRDAPVDKVVDRYFEQFQILYDAEPSVRNFFAITVPPLLRTPLGSEQSEEGQARIQKQIDAFNDDLASGLDAFASANSGAVVQLIDSSAPFNKALDDPSAYGAPNATCENMDGTSCLWWDELHPGVAIQKLLAETVAAAWKGTFF